MGADLKRSALGAPGSIRVGNKAKRQSLYIRHKQGWGKERREQRFARKKEEKRDPELRRQRLATNRPVTIDDKRIWDDGDADHLGAVVDVVKLKRRKLEEGYEATGIADVDEQLEPPAEGDDDVDSMLDSDEEIDGAVADTAALDNARAAQRDTSLAPSIAPSTTSTNLDLTPESLALKFPTLFTEDAPPQPKILMTTSLNSHIHHEAEILCSLFPNTTYIRRSAHRYGHKYSIREISKFATNRDYTAVIVLKEDQKNLTGLTIIHLPAGPSFSFSISSWIEGKKLPGHGNATNHYPELLLNGFHTPLGILAARMFQRLFVPQPEIQGRQVVSITNQRDWLFVRRWRYKFAVKRETEKQLTDADGKPLKGVEDIRARLQPLGPSFCMKLRKVYKGIGFAGSEGDDAIQWEFKPKLEKQRTRFYL